MITIKKENTIHIGSENTIILMDFYARIFSK